VGALLAALLAVGAIGRARWSSRQQRKYLAPRLDLAVGGDPQTVARGRHLARTLGGCTECHGADLGGRVMADEPMLRLVAPNGLPCVANDRPILRRWPPACLVAESAASDA
jgi:hypothetical protein